MNRCTLTIFDILCSPPLRLSSLGILVPSFITYIATRYETEIRGGGSGGVIVLYDGDAADLTGAHGRPVSSGRAASRKQYYYPIKKWIKSDGERTSEPKHTSTVIFYRFDNRDDDVQNRKHSQIPTITVGDVVWLLATIN